MHHALQQHGERLLGRCHLYQVLVVGLDARAECGQDALGGCGPVKGEVCDGRLLSRVVVRQAPCATRPASVVSASSAASIAVIMRLAAFCTRASWGMSVSGVAPHACT